ncbi:hypothetical protein [Rhizobium sp. FKL33]|uniref:hypothetical protein n=1 Tax=Rhizobium sp. FKL33 TaxID=2562307 RepID=UPI0010C0D383|nr:hypothetical protein [Rhizobium sp. FKL33]
MTDRKTERRLMRMMAARGIGAMTYEDSGTDLTITLPKDLIGAVSAPQAGRFTLSTPEGEEPMFPRRVRAGEILACLRVGPLLLPVSATSEGTCPPPLAEEGDLVGFGELLF